MKKQIEFSLEELREINFVVSCVLQDKKDLRPTAEQHLKNIFKKTYDALRYKQEEEKWAMFPNYETPEEKKQRRAEENANIQRVDAQTRGKNNV